jgi:hypothetical protein
VNSTIVTVSRAPSPAVFVSKRTRNLLANAARHAEGRVGLQLEQRQAAARLVVELPALD